MKNWIFLVWAWRGFERVLHSATKAANRLVTVAVQRRHSHFTAKRERKASCGKLGLGIAPSLFFIEASLLVASFVRSWDHVGHDMRCPNCGSQSFASTEHGYFVCNRCATQSQEVAEVNEIDGIQYRSSQFRKNKRAPTERTPLSQNVEGSISFLILFISFVSLISFLY
jgi:hypothetical protein